LAINLGPADNLANLSLKSVKFNALDEHGRIEAINLKGLEYLFPVGKKNEAQAEGPNDSPVPTSFTFKELSAIDFDLRPLVQRLTHLSLNELAEMLLINLKQPSLASFSADLALARPVGASKVELSELQLTFSQGAFLAAQQIELAPFHRFNLKARVKNISFNLPLKGESESESNSGPDSGPESGSAEAEPKSLEEPATDNPAPTEPELSSRNFWPELLTGADLSRLASDLEISSAYDPTEQSYILELKGSVLPELLKGDFRLELADLDRASLVSLSHLNSGNLMDPLLESGLYHSKLISLSLSLNDGGLTDRLVLAFPPTTEKTTTVAEKSQRLSDLFEMVLTMRLDNIVENTDRLATRIRTFLSEPDQIALTIIPKPPLSPGEVRFTRDRLSLMNSTNISLTVNNEPPLKVIFRTDPAAFDRDFIHNEFGLYPGETRP
jgi:hypothetical protein